MSETTTHDNLDGYELESPLDGDTDGDLDAPAAFDAAEAGYRGLSGAAGRGWTPDGHERPASTMALFDGDEGGLELNQGGAVVVLLTNRFNPAHPHPMGGAGLVADPRPVRSRLNDLFMDLQLDRDREVAYKRQVAPEGGGRPFPTLLYDTPWGREETILLVYLRSRYRGEQAAGADRVFVDREDMLEHVTGYRPEHATDVTGDEKKAARAVESLYKAGLLVGPSAGDRFEVSAAIEVLLPLEKLQALLAWLRSQNAGTDPTGDDTDDDTDDDTGDDTDLSGTLPEPSGETDPGTDSGAADESERQ